MSESEALKQLVSQYGKRSYEKGAGYGDENTDIILVRANRLIDAQQARLEVMEASDAAKAARIAELEGEVARYKAALEAIEVASAKRITDSVMSPAAKATMQQIYRTAEQVLAGGEAG